MEATFFETPEDFRVWLEANYKIEKELVVGFYKKATGLKSIDWSESVDQALCFGWIDGIRRKIDEKSYSIRFTPRRPRSHWSDVNIKKVAVLTEQGLMKPEGLAAFEKRTETNSRNFGYEQSAANLSTEFLEKLKANEKAWIYYDKKLAPSYKKSSNNWVMSAKREATRLKRLQILIESCEAELKIPMLRRK